MSVFSLIARYVGALLLLYLGRFFQFNLAKTGAMVLVMGGRVGTVLHAAVSVFVRERALVTKNENGGRVKRWIVCAV